MTKEEAREILENWMCERGSCEFDINLPIIDEKINIIESVPIKKGPLEWGTETIFQDYTFKGLIKIAYDLEDKK